MFVNVVLREVPTAVTAPTITAAIKAANNPYSMAVAPSSSFMKRIDLINHSASPNRAKLKNTLLRQTARNITDVDVAPWLSVPSATRLSGTNPDPRFCAHASRRVRLYREGAPDRMRVSSSWINVRRPTKVFHSVFCRHHVFMLHYRLLHEKTCRSNLWIIFHIVFRCDRLSFC